MKELALSIEHLSKSYQLGSGHAANFREFLSTLNRKKQTSTFNALSDITLDVYHGETVAIIGANGAGKSTLLKVLSKITKPTSGKITLYGKVSALLEVGTGFHPELTGKENIFLNGAILGMSQREVRQRFDEIVDFSGVEKFLNTPVKHYSSGMYVRLAFAVSAHLEPEILIVDEVLAVGDVDFQRKCLSKMSDVASQGRTVIFVSHNMDAVERWCKRGIVLQKGRMVFDGSVSSALEHYLGKGGSPSSVHEWNESNAPGNDLVRLLYVSAHSQGSEVNSVNQFDVRKDIVLTFRFRVNKNGACLHPAFHLKDKNQQVVFMSYGFQQENKNRTTFDKGVFESTCIIPGNLLAEGKFYLFAIISELDQSGIQFNNYVLEDDIVSFQVYDPAEGESARGRYKGPLPGVVRPILNWSTEEVGS